MIAIMQRPTILIVKTGSALPAVRARHGDFDDWFKEGLGTARFAFQTCAIEQAATALLALDPDRFDGIVLTGSAAMVSDRLHWFEAALPWLRAAHAAGRPLLGVCFGHQLLAHALGGRVGPNPAGRRMGSCEVHVGASNDPLLGGLAPAAWFQISHVEVVLAPPSGARVVATAAHDACHGLHYGALSWGVQFHPEWSAAIMDGYLQARADAMSAEGQDARCLRRNVRDCLAGAAVLGAFADRVERHARRPGECGVDGEVRPCAVSV